MRQSNETAHAQVVFMHAAAKVTRGRRSWQVMPAQLLEVDTRLHEWIKLLKLDIERKEMLDGPD